ncbi:jg27856 [Pararge aegeria aegeria]|uniref:Jg27856 protein n=1 Tax=Pararge aegeria aegeria TaxID=348720 RepID=A0A8S4QQA1_9NEOP|nr:jg27856 [Pararge aegeria aegeria]
MASPNTFFKGGWSGETLTGLIKVPPPIQHYLSELEKSENLSWFSYSLPQDKSLKVAIRGVPVDTDPDELKEELCNLGSEPELVRPIQARQGRPGCRFFAVENRGPYPPHI